MMVSTEGIDKLREQLTDQYVVVQGDWPELARFQDQTGQVKTVNCNGRALVEFDGFGNRGWYDIGPDYLRIVPKPEPKLPEKPAAKPAVAKPAASPSATAPKDKSDSGSK
jgi:hypothetical protein